MNEGWRYQLGYDPLPALLESGNAAIEYFTRRDLLGEHTVPLEELWEAPEVHAILRRQREDGSWSYPGAQGSPRTQENYDQVETYRQLGFLVEKYGMQRAHPAIERAARFLCFFQSEEGDFRGIYASQYSPNYTAGIMELLIKAGYADHARIARGFEWLLSIRQNDGGWAIAMRTLDMKWERVLQLPYPLQPDRSRPFSHLVTGVVLRAFAAHPRWRISSQAYQVGELLAGRFFQSDKYTDRRAPSYWERPSFPFWFTDYVSALDSLSLIGIGEEHPNVARALDWLRGVQAEDGCFDLKFLRGKDPHTRQWVTLAICRVLKRLQDRMMKTNL